MSKVNLLPPELRQRQVERRTTTLVAAIGAAVLTLILVFYFFQTMQLSSAQDELAEQRQANADLSAQIAELQPYADLQADLAAKQQLVDSLYLNEVSWAGVLLDVSRVIPDESYLTNLTGQITAPTGTQVGTPVEGGTTSLIGSVTFSGVARETRTIASWLTRLEQIRGWVNPWVNNAQENAAFSRIYTFDGGLDLTIDAATERGRGEGRRT
ncbi:MAG TPA: PilN domain-containing protein [Actinomycetota bacterium]|nr:PilN domain-containing protein [Actinomycetota bacterium]HSD49263.1 PilN domain-containing protein [Actinomycetota bacterium]